MSKENRDSHSDPINIKKSVENVKNSISNSANDIADEVEKVGSSVLSKNNIKEIAEKIASDIGNFLKEQKEDLSNAKGKYKQQIKDNPFLAVLSAAFVGAILGFIFRK